MMKKMGLIIALIFSASLQASEIANTKITKLMIDKNHNLGMAVFIKTDGVANRTLGLGCHDNVSWDYVLDISEEYGKQMYSMLLTARASQKDIKLVGVNQSTCDVYSNIETLRRVEL